jgi:ferritin-like metal-binding protein YciE
MDMNNLRDLYVDELRDLLSCESQLIKALPKMAKAASAPRLKQAFESHLEQTKGHLDRLQQIFGDLGMSARARKCKGIEGIIDEGKEMMSETDTPDVCDASLIAAAQRAEHYEMAAYCTVRTYAQFLGDEAASRLLQQTLDEEGETDKKLTSLAENGINIRAEQAGAQA